MVYVNVKLNLKCKSVCKSVFYFFSNGKQPIYQLAIGIIVDDNESLLSLNNIKNNKRLEFQ